MLPGEEQVIQAIERVSPAVVNISTARVFRHFHWYYFHDVPARGIGSGTIMTEDGIVLTNNHVVEGSNEVDVTLISGERRSGRIVGADRATDIAVIKIEGTGLPVCPTGDSSGLRVGQSVFAVGNSLGLAGGPTVTGGMVSSLVRSIHFPGGILENLIQTDAPINPGNSGGPLIDSSGQAIGVNTAIVPFANGIGFAIPINAAMETANELRSFGRIQRPWLGVYGRDVTSPVANYYGLSVQQGALVMRTIPNSPADRAGIEAGDVIVGINNTKVDNMGVLLNEIKKHKAHERLDMKMVRGSQSVDTTVELEQSP